MQATVELQVVPIGDGVSVRRQIESVVEMLNGYGLFSSFTLVVPI